MSSSRVIGFATGAVLFALALWSAPVVADQADVQALRQFRLQTMAELQALDATDQPRAERESDRLTAVYLERLKAVAPYPQVGEEYFVSASPATFLHERGLDALMGYIVGSEAHSFFCSTRDLLGDAPLAALMRGDASGIIDDSAVEPQYFLRKDPTESLFLAVNTQDDGHYLPNMIFYVIQVGSQIGASWSWVPESNFSDCREVFESTKDLTRRAECLARIVSKQSDEYDQRLRDIRARVRSVCRMGR